MLIALKIILSSGITIISFLLLRGIWTHDIIFNPNFLLEAIGIQSKSSPHRLDINYKNTLCSKFVSTGNSKSSNIGLAFYEFAIANSSSENWTIKEVLLRYSLEEKIHEDISYVLNTSEIYSPTEKRNVNTVRFVTKKDSIVLMGWNNLRVELEKNNAVPPGGVIKGSAYFVLDIKDPDDLRKIQNMQIIIRDFLGQESRHSVSFPDKAAMEAKTIVLNN